MILLPDTFNNSPIIVWGTGLFYQQTRKLFHMTDPIFFIDSDIQKQRNLFEGKEVKDPLFLKTYTHTTEKILVFVTVYQPIKNILESFNLIEEIDFIFPQLCIYKQFINSHIVSSEKL